MMGAEVPKTGLATHEVYQTLQTKLDEKPCTVILILDEIDELVNKIGDEVLYSLTRLNSELEKSQICLVGISNDMTFANNLEPRVRSSLNEEDVTFSPYNAMQLQQILHERSKQAFSENAVAPGVIEKCAAFAARDHGDARRALDLLRVAGEICDRNSEEQVTIEHVDQSERKIEKDKVIDIVKSQPMQSQATLYSILQVTNLGEYFFTGDIYETYKEICTNTSLRPLTMRRISDIIAELDSLGIINTQVMSKGRYGRTRKISLSLPPGMSPKLQELLGESLGL
jgi:cell division control protein 6